MDSLNTKHGRVHICKGDAELATETAEEFVRVVNAAISKTGRATVVLSGGSTPHLLYARLLESDLKNAVDWSKVHFFMGDERTVNQDSPESNWGNAWRQLLSKLNLPANNLHPMHEQDKDPEKCAADYERDILAFFGGNGIPSFDLLHLGMGPDGHCASLFPGTKALDEDKRLVVNNWVEKLDTNRVTFTLPLINAAAYIMFMVEGENKSAVLAEALQSDKLSYPVQRIRPTSGHLDWFVDEAAAHDLKARS